MAKNSDSDGKGFLQLIAEEIDRYTPKEGFNLCGLDDFEDFGERVHLIAHFSTLKEARELRDRFLNEKPDDDLVIYDASGLSVE
ncbi:MAG TPA: hypothetical protein VMK12_08620 [Anaeromyxobacteraceae bacterium]|nr:hypothetical protein [Anaeromyxobacteraceae bacterium]